MSQRTFFFLPYYFIFLLSGFLNAEDLRIYYVGNSLTIDAKPPQVKSTLGRAGFNVIYGQNILSGQGLSRIVANPDDANVESLAPFGPWDEGLANHEWDVVTLQAYPGGNALEEVAATRQLIETATSGGRNADCKFFLYLAWPMSSETEGFSERVRTDFRGASRRVFLNRGFMDYWYQEVTASFPNLDIRLIPTGIAYATLDEKLREIPIAEFTNTYSLYRDVHHMIVRNGNHLALTMMLCAISGIHPAEQKYSETHLRETNDPLRELANDVAWHSLNADARTGVRGAKVLSMNDLAEKGMREISFVGSLETSSTLTGNWQKMTNATSPYRFRITEPSRFYRVR